MIVKKQQSGFTLIELAVVLVIMGVLAGSIISTLGARIGNIARSETKKELEQIKQAVIGFALVNKRLPCPDTPAGGDGLSETNCNGGVTTPDEGILPWVTLGVGAGDAWGNRYDYWVLSSYTTADITLGTAGTPGIVKTNTNGVDVDLANNVVAVIYSRGKNGLGAVATNGALRSVIPPGPVHADEIENADGDKEFFSRPPTTDEASADIFDDIVVWISAYELKAKMVEAGVLP